MQITQATQVDKIIALGKLDGWTWSTVTYDSINSKVSVFNPGGSLEDYAIIRSRDVEEQNAFIIACLPRYLTSFNDVIPLMQELELWVIIMKDLAFQITPVTPLDICDRLLLVTKTFA